MLEDENATLNGKSNPQQFSQAKTSASSDIENHMIFEPVKITKEVRAYCTNEPGKKKGDEEMLCIDNNQPTEEFPVEANEAFQDAENRRESAERVDWNQAQYKPEKKTPEATFII